MRFVQAWDNLGLAPLGWGSHIMLLWRDFEPGKGQYNYALVERALAAAERPCYLQIGFSMYDKTLRAPVDYTPVAQRRTLVLTAASGVTGHVPDYSPAWTDALCAATSALANRFKGHRLVAGFWPALGWNQETQAAVNNSGGAWAQLLAPRLAEQRYFDFVSRYALHARDAWAPLPVYVPGAPSPGGVWGHRRRDVIARLLDEECGYMNCGWLADHPQSWGVEAHAGTGMHDIVIGRTERVGYEEGPRLAYDDPGEMYWMLLRAWDRADFVCLYKSLSAGQAAAVAPRMPQTSRWFVWRQAEYAPQVFKGGDGRLYGTTGEPGCWGRGLQWESGGTLVFDATRWDQGRHLLRAMTEVVLVVPGVPDGLYEVLVYGANGVPAARELVLQGGRLRLPPGDYHRLDWVGPVEQPTFEEALRAAAEAHDVLPINETAALAAAGLQRGWWPTSDEFELIYGGTAYVAQRFRVPAAREVAVLYCVRGEWEQVGVLRYDNG